MWLRPPLSAAAAVAPAVSMAYEPPITSETNNEDRTSRVRPALQPRRANALICRDEVGRD